MFTISKQSRRLTTSSGRGRSPAACGMQSFARGTSRRARARFGVAGTTTSVNSLHSFDGWGPTLSLEGRRSFGQTGLAFDGNVRGSMLFGDTTQVVTTTTAIPPGAATVTNHNAALDRAAGD